MMFDKLEIEAENPLTWSQERSYCGNLCSKLVWISQNHCLRGHIPSGMPNRPRGFSCPIFPVVPRWRARSKLAAVIPVSIRPGQILLILMCVLCNWKALVWAMLFTLNECQRKVETWRYQGDIRCFWCTVCCKLMFNLLLKIAMYVRTVKRASPRT